MSNEELNRKMEFIVEQQAQFASDIQELRDEIQNLKDGVQDLKDGVQDLKDVVTLQSEVANTALQSASATTAISMTLIDRYKELADAQTGTQHTVDRLARLVLHHASDGHGYRGPALQDPTL